MIIASILQVLYCDSSGQRHLFTSCSQQVWRQTNPHLPGEDTKLQDGQSLAGEVDPSGVDPQSHRLWHGPQGRRAAKQWGKGEYTGPILQLHWYSFSQHLQPCISNMCGCLEAPQQGIHHQQESR